MEQSYLSAGDLLSFATNYLASFQQLTASSSKVTHQAPPVRWSPPGLDEVKLNFDGAIFASSVEVGIGIIARDSAGACVGWKSVRKQGSFVPEMVEAMAAREAILLACRVGWRRIILEGDCANIYQKLSALSPDCSALGAIIRDIKCLALNFDLCSFSLVRRSGNKVAHCLARRASLFASEESSISPALFELCSLMLTEFMVPDILREEAWINRRRNLRLRRGRSVTDDDLDELRGCLDLGFDFDSPDLDPKLSSTLPALQFYYAVNRQYSHTLSRSSSASFSDCDTASTSSVGSPGAIIDPGEKPEMVKTRLRQWASGGVFGAATPA
ncbi:hypothetical protein Sango_0906400 [Sesamum angolense]|uniref:RNase H type-1 domain-containing protein n=1 Tax=Sesamum angolense TaxID=2727404 RepID=A0AAE2BXR6_9LAMI|nr:hypothetical protein Sango_0906400 [Sesamum angolense]